MLQIGDGNSQKYKDLWKLVLYVFDKKETKLNKLLIIYNDEIKETILDDISKISRGASPRPIKKYITKQEDGVNWIKIGDTNPLEKYVYSCKEKITKEGEKFSKKVKSGDFILSNSMSFGRPYILKIDGCIHDGWLSISDFEEHILSDYLYYLLISDEVQKQMEEKASSGGAVNNLNAEIVKQLKIIVPPLEIQIEIVNTLDKFNDKINHKIFGLKKEIENREIQTSHYLNDIFSYLEKNKIVA